MLKELLEKGFKSQAFRKSSGDPGVGKGGSVLFCGPG